MSITKNGDVYFTDATAIRPYWDGEKWEVLKGSLIDIGSQNPTGRVLKYSPKTKKTEVILKNIQFANGIALSKDEDYFLVAETGKYKILKYWLKGEKKGKTELFAICSGFCDNISISKDGKSYWVGIPTMRNDFYDTIHNIPILKKLILSLPEGWVALPPDNGLVVQYDENGNTLQILHDSKGNTIRNINSANENNGKLYLGNVKSHKFGIYDLKK